jgi:hypothetical protein
MASKSLCSVWVLRSLQQEDVPDDAEKYILGCPFTK